MPNVYFIFGVSLFLKILLIFWHVFSTNAIQIICTFEPFLFVILQNEST